MKKLLAFLILACAANLASAQNTTTTASASQQSAATSTAQGTIQFSQTPEHTTATVRNVSAPILGAYAASFSQMNCSSTVQAGLAVAGLSVGGGASRDSESCVYEVMAAESVRQSTVTQDRDTANKLQQAAINARCMISKEATAIMESAGLTCQTRVDDPNKPRVDKPSVAAIGEPQDPLVRSRMGLVALK